MSFKDALVITVATCCIITGAVCGIVGGACGMAFTAVVIHDLVDGV